MSLVPNNSLRYRSDYPGDTRCADCESCACKKEVRTKALDEAVSALRKARLHKHENVAGCLRTKGAQKQSDADIEAIEALK